MFDLSGIARHLKVSVDQIRIAADLLEQGFSPSFIERYRGDETSSLPGQVIHRLKYEIDRRNRIESSKKRVLRQLPKDSNLDSEMERALSDAQSTLAVEVAARCFRARRALEQSQDRAGTPGKLLEAMLTYSGPPVDDVKGWVASQLEDGNQDVDLALSQVGRLIAALMSSDTSLNTKMRQFVERNAILSVVDVPDSVAGATSSLPAASQPVPSQPVSSQPVLSQPVSSQPVPSQPVAEGRAQAGSEIPRAEEEAESLGATDEQAISEEYPEDHAAGYDSDQDQESMPEGEELEDSHDDSEGASDSPAQSSSSESASPSPASSSHRLPSKLTPRQRRRRWLMSVLSSLKSTKKAVNRLSAYQQLMLARGVRSRLIDTPLSYNLSGLVDIARNSFTDAKHPFAEWFRHAVAQALEHGQRSRIEADAMAEMEERASEILLEHATDELRRQLMQRPVRGHTIALIDTVGPKSVSVVFVAPTGRVLACEELPCSVHPEIVSQNVVKLGEWMHKHRVTLVALTNGPARRFMMTTLRELMLQSKDSGLRWTMADRSGAEAYAGGKIGLRELSIYNRRQRAAIWAARCLQDPLVELLKVDTSRLRLGSYQRELPQEAVRHQIQETLSACVCERGIDTQNSSEFELQFVPGVRAEQAKQIVSLARTGCLKSRSQLSLDIQGWNESDRRHALAWLRVFGSDNALDATLIHPEDYRLAQRLIEHAGFLAPSNAPPGWVHRTLDPSPTSVELAIPSVVAEVASSPSDESPVVQNEVLEGATEQTEVVTEPASEQPESNENSQLESGIADGPSVHAEGLDSQDALQSIKQTWESANPGGEAPPPEEPATMQSVQPPEYPEHLAEMAPPALEVDCDKLANQWQVGRSKLKTVASCLADPFGDPRLAGVPVPMMTEMPTLDNLQPDMCVWAIVVGVADFGAFVELGPNCSGLIHISRLSTQFIEDPHQCVQVGDLILTWVVSIDRKKNRVALTALSPAQRIQMKEEAEARKAREEEDRYQRNRGGFRKDSQGERSASRGQQQGSGNRHQGDTSSGHGQQRPRREGSAAGSPAGGAARFGNSGGQGRRSGDRRGGSTGSDRGRGRDAGSRSAKSVVVTSKKPVAPISQAMKQGEEPLRSFSDLFQFFESKKTDDVPVSVEVQPVVVQAEPPPIPEVVSEAAQTLTNPINPSSD